MDESMPVEEAFLTPSSSHYFTNAQHKKQDEEVTLAVSKLFAGKQELDKTDCVFLLHSIIKRSGGKLRVEFIDGDKAIKLMCENPKLESALEKAWRTKDYKEIRNSASSLAGG